MSELAEGQETHAVESPLPNSPSGRRRRFATPRDPAKVAAALMKAQVIGIKINTDIVTGTRKRFDEMLSDLEVDDEVPRMPPRSSKHAAWSSQPLLALANRTFCSGCENIRACSHIVMRSAR